MPHENGHEQAPPTKVGCHDVPTGYTVVPDLYSLSISPGDLLKARPDIYNIVAGAVVFKPPAAGDHRKILLLQRASSDSFPLTWEVPAGTADPAVDKSIVGVAVRELWEETRLRARRIYGTASLGDPSATKDVVFKGPIKDARMDTEYAFSLLQWDGRTWAVASFLTDVEDHESPVCLLEQEHVDWAWITEDEVSSGRFGTGKRLELVSEAMKMVILEAFRLKKAEDSRNGNRTATNSRREAISPAKS